MGALPSGGVALAAIALVASIVNGALGYGFSSIAVPLALLFLTNRVLNPALVLMEVVLNIGTLWVNRAALPKVWRRTMPLVVGLLPGIALGIVMLARINSSWLKLITYASLLPLILAQAGGLRRVIRAERSVGVAFGGGVGVLYAMTTISGPPLAMFLSNQGFVKEEFRAALGFVRLVESAGTALAYGYAGLYSRRSVLLVPYMLPGLLIGVPLGALVTRWTRPEAFRRICMSVDAWIVAYGLATVSRELRLLSLVEGIAMIAGVVAIDAALVYRFVTAACTE